jgi:hypothetical protein
MLGISVWAFVERPSLKRVFEKLTLPLAKQGSSARFGLLSMRKWEQWTNEDFLAGLSHPIAIAGLT